MTEFSPNKSTNAELGGAQKKNELDSLNTPSIDVSAYTFDNKRQITTFKPNGGPDYTFTRDSNGLLYNVSYKHEGSNYSYQKNYGSNTWSQIKDGYYTGATWQGEIGVDAINGYRLTSATNNPQQLSSYIKPDGSRVTERHIGQTTLRGDSELRLTDVFYKGGCHAKITYADKSSKTPSGVVITTSEGEEVQKFTYDAASKTWKQEGSQEGLQLQLGHDGSISISNGKETKVISSDGEFKTQSAGITRHQDLVTKRIHKIVGRGCEQKFTYDKDGSVETVETRRGMKTSILHTADHKDFNLNDDGTYHYTNSEGNKVSIASDLTETTSTPMGQFIGATSIDGHERIAKYDGNGNLYSINEKDKRGKNTEWTALLQSNREVTFVPTQDKEKFGHIEFDSNGLVKDFNFETAGKFSFEYKENNRQVSTFNVHIKNGEISEQYVREGNTNRWKVFRRDETSGELTHNGGFATFDVSFTKNGECAIKLSNGKYNIYSADAKASSTNTVPDELKVRTNIQLDYGGSITYQENGKSATRQLGRSIDGLRETMLDLLGQAGYQGDVERVRGYAQALEERMRRQGLLMTKNGVRDGGILAEEKVLKTYENLIAMMSETSNVEKFFSANDRTRLAAQAMRQLANPQAVRQGAQTCGIGVVEVGTLHLNPQNYTDFIKQVTLEGKVKLRAIDESKPGQNQLIEKDIVLDLDSLRLKDGFPEKQFFLASSDQNHLRSWVSRVFQVGMINATRKFEGTHRYEFRDEHGENPQFMVREIRRASEFLNGMKLPTLNHGQTHGNNYLHSLKNGLPVLALTAGGGHIRAYVPQINDQGVVTGASLDNTYNESNDDQAFNIEHISVNTDVQEHRLLASNF